jgi:glycosyltransferase involved in cell wall biosynthesis
VTCITTVIPCYNHGAVVARAVRSVYAQTGDLDLVVIIVDDGSTDDTPDACRLLSEEFPQLRVIRKVNGGVSSARNSGIEVARGDFIHFLDSDDYLATSMYSEMVAALDAPDRPADVAYCGYVVVDTAGTMISSTSGVPMVADMRESLLIGCLGPPHSFIVRRSAVEAAGRFDTRLSECADWDYWLRLALLRCVFVHVPRPLVWYELGATNMSRNYLRMVSDAEAALLKNKAAVTDARLEPYWDRGFHGIRQCMFDNCYAPGMRGQLENGRFVNAARDVGVLLRKDPKSTWPAINSLMRHKRAIARGMRTLLSRRLRLLNGRSH